MFIIVDDNSGIPDSDSEDDSEEDSVNSDWPGEKIMGNLYNTRLKPLLFS